MPNRLNYQSGVTVIETIVALVILGVIGVLLVQILLRVEAANNSARLRNQSAKYAEEAIEQARGWVQNPSNGWSGLNGLVSSGKPAYFTDGTMMTSPTMGQCMVYTPTMNYSGVCITGSIHRVVIVNQPDANGGIRVQALVSWGEKGNNKFTETDTNFYNY